MDPSAATISQKNVMTLTKFHISHFPFHFHFHSIQPVIPPLTSYFESIDGILEGGGGGGGGIVTSS